jgi:hypothetical protein
LREVGIANDLTRKVELLAGDGVGIMRRFEILKMQPAFLAALSFSTEWARERFPTCIVTAKIAEAERLLALLEGGNL